MVHLPALNPLSYASQGQERILVERTTPSIKQALGQEGPVELMNVD